MSYPVVTLVGWAEVGIAVDGPNVTVFLLLKVGVAAADMLGINVFVAGVALDPAENVVCWGWEVSVEVGKLNEVFWLAVEDGRLPNDKPVEVLTVVLVRLALVPPEK